MANKFLTDITSYAGTGANALTNGIFHIVDTNDTAQDPAGSSFKISGSALRDILAKNIYTDNGTLTANRTVTQGGFSLNFIGGIITIGADGVGSATERFFVRQDGNGTVASEAALLIDSPASLVTARTGALTNVHFHSFDAGLNLRADIIGTSVEAALIYEGINKTISVRKIVAEIFHDVKARIESPIIQLVTGTPVIGHVFTCTNANGTGVWSAPGGLSGGTTDFVARWTSSTTLGIGVITDDGTKVGIGGVVAGAKLSVTSSSGTNLRLIGTGSLTLFSVLDSGRVGIGVTTPTDGKLQINNSDSGVDSLRIISTTGTNRTVYINSSLAGFTGCVDSESAMILSASSGTDIRVRTVSSNSIHLYTNSDTARGLFIGTTNLVGFSVLTPTAKADIEGASTAAASLRIRSGTAPTSPNDGDLWYDGTDVKFRVGATTKTFTLV